MKVYMQACPPNTALITGLFQHPKLPHKESHCSSRLPIPLSLLPFTLYHGLLLIFADAYPSLCFSLASSSLEFPCTDFVVPVSFDSTSSVCCSFVWHALSHTFTHVCVHVYVHIYMTQSKYS